MPRDVSKDFASSLQPDPARLASQRNNESGKKEELDSEGGPEALRHPCAVCTKRFTTKGHLSRHMRIHSGERKYQCPFPGCSTRTARADNLQQHYRIHLGSRTTKRCSRSLDGVVVLDTRPKSKLAPKPYPRELTPPLDNPPALELTTLTIDSARPEDNVGASFSSLNQPPQFSPTSASDQCHPAPVGEDPIHNLQEYPQVQPQSWDTSSIQEETSSPYSSAEPEIKSEVYTPPSVATSISHPASPEDVPQQLYYFQQYVDAEGSISPSEAAVMHHSRPPRSAHAPQILINIPSRFEAESLSSPSPILAYPAKVASPLTGVSSDTLPLPLSLDSPRRNLGSISSHSGDGSYPSSPYCEVHIPENPPGVEHNGLQYHVDVPLAHPIPRPASLMPRPPQSTIESPTPRVSYSSPPPPQPVYYHSHPNEQNSQAIYAEYSLPHSEAARPENVQPPATVEDRRIPSTMVSYREDVNPSQNRSAAPYPSQGTAPTQPPFSQSDYFSAQRSGSGYEIDGWRRQGAGHYQPAALATFSWPQYSTEPRLAMYAYHVNCGTNGMSYAY